MDKRALYIGINELQEVVTSLDHFLEDELMSPKAQNEMEELRDLTQKLQTALYAKGREDT